MKNKTLAVNPVAVVIQLLGAKWKILIIQRLLNKEMRFCELKKSLGCTAKVLSNCLQELEQDGFVIREQNEDEINRVEYYLTDIGYTLKPVIDSMYEWGKDYKKLRKLMLRKQGQSI